MKQEVRIKLDISLTVDARHDAARVREIVLRGAELAYRNNPRHINSLSYAEEAALYGEGETKWEVIYSPEPSPEEIASKIMQHVHPDVVPRVQMELDIVRRLLRVLREGGYEVIIDEEEKLVLADEMEALELIFNLDECYIFAKKDYVNSFVRLVRGNDGWDVICDYSTELEEALKPVNDYAAKLGE